MNRIISLALVATFVISTPALAVLGDWDLWPAPFRDGVNTTVQVWSFGDEGDLLTPSPVDNAAGTPELVLGGELGVGVQHLASFDGRDGVLVISNETQDGGDLGDLTITVPNFDAANPQKSIWVQMLYQASGIPQMWAAAEGSDDYAAMTLVEQEPMQGDWVLGVWEWTLEPNPQSETIVVRPRDCAAYVDVIAIETQCVPEPGMLALLGLGAVVIRRRL